MNTITIIVAITVTNPIAHSLTLTPVQRIAYQMKEEDGLSQVAPPPPEEALCTSSPGYVKSQEDVNRFVAVFDPEAAAEDAAAKAAFKARKGGELSEDDYADHGDTKESMIKARCIHMARVIHTGGICPQSRDICDATISARNIAVL